MIFLTCNDAPSGILKSQVIDVVEVVKQRFDPNIRLVAFISIRNFKANKRWIKERSPDAKVLPMFPKLKNWRYNAILLWCISFFVNTDIIIARGVFATNLALKNKKMGRTKKVCYDGRGAFSAEVVEYDVIPDKGLVRDIPRLEKKAVLDSDTRIAVTSSLVRWWEKEFGYQPGSDVVIPCTVSASKPDNSDPKKLFEQVMSPRRKLGWGQYDVVLIYSGSVAGWQSFDLLNNMFTHFIGHDTRIKILFMSPEDDLITKLIEKYPDQVQRLFVKPEEVLFYLRAGDYGLMIREDSVTNGVASPTKFAEYLLAGLRVLTSGNIGDYSSFVRKNNCGEIVTSKDYEGITLLPINTNERKNLMTLGYENFSKQSSRIKDAYQSLFKDLMNLS
jgi:hypothetical protein